MTLPRPVALATSAAHLDLTADDRLLVPELAARGITAEPAVWNDPAVDWSRFAAVVLRSTWDYHLSPAPFLDWVRGLAARGARLFNAHEIVRWNADKRYLLELESRGASIVPTVYVERGASAALGAIARERSWREVVVKPAISATAHDTWRSGAPVPAVDETRFHERSAAGGVLVQPFVAEIESAGEWSLVFFAGRYSHAVIKRPRAGEYRVQSHFGGSVEAAAPDARVLEAARAVMRSLPFPPSACLFARVDGVVHGGAFRLMELELIEPALFLAAHGPSAARFAGVIAARAARRITSAGG